MQQKKKHSKTKSSQEKHKSLQLMGLLADL